MRGFREPFGLSLVTYVIIAHRMHLAGVTVTVGISAIYCNVPLAHASEATDWPPAGTPKMLVRKTLRANPGHSSL